MPTKSGAKKKGGSKKASAKKSSAKKGGAKKGGAKQGAIKAAASSQRSITAALGTIESSAETLQTEAEPTKNECIIWRNGSFHQKVVLAVAVWAQEDPNGISMTDTLGSLAKGVPWDVGPGQQARLVQTTNLPNINVFAPFSGTKMVPPPQHLPASTTVAQWERMVWQQQSPRTPCFFKVP